MLRVTLAGKLSLGYRGRHLDEADLTGRQFRLVLAMLIVQRPGPISPERLADELWPEAMPTQWRVAIRGLVAQVRRVFDRLDIDGRAAVRSSAGAYVVRLPETTVDLEEAVTWAAQARAAAAAGEHRRAADHAGAARSVVSRPILAGVESPWVDQQREAALRLRVEALTVIGTSRSELGEAAAAVTALCEATNLAPYDEHAWRALMCAHATAGRVAEGLMAYETLRRRLSDELGVDPSPETRELHMRLAQTTATPIVVSDRVTPVDDRVPYRGLAAFDVEDADLFYGREPETQTLIDLLGHHHAVAVVGASGSGKSSLVRAGLLPALERGAVTDADTWPRVIVVPGARPIESLARSLAVMGPGVSHDHVRERLEATPNGLDEIARTIVDGAGSQTCLLLLVDQLEELFTVASNSDEAMHFLSQLQCAIRAPDSRVRVVVALRADFYGHAIAVPCLAHLLSTSQLALGPLSGDGLEAAITGPARRCGLEVEPGLVGLVVTDAGGQPGGLPLMQHALLQTWQQRADGLLTKDAYTAIGGVGGALARHADTVLDALQAPEQQVARRLLLRTVHPGEGRVPDARRRVRSHEVLADPAGAAVASGVVERLVDARLLVTTRDPVDGRPTVELAHEALIDAWPRLRSWVDEERTLLRAARRITAAARAWAEGDAPPDDQLARTGVPQQLLGVAPRLLTAEEEAYLRACLDHAQQVARRRRRRQATVVAALSFTLVVVSVLAIVATVQRGRAEHRERVARAQALAADSVAQLDVDPDLALHLALAAAEATPNDADPVPAATEALHRAVLEHRVVHVLTDGGPQVQMLDAETVVTSSTPDRPAAVHNVATGERRGALDDTGPVDPTIDGPRGPPSVTAASADGTAYAEVVGDGSVRVWATRSSALVAAIPGAGAAPHALAVSGDGTLIAVGGVSDTRGPSVTIHDLRMGEVSAAVQLPAPATGLDFTTDGSTVAITTLGDRNIRLVETATGDFQDELATTRPEGAPSGGHLSDVTWLADDTRLATGTVNPPGVQMVAADGQDVQAIDLTAWGVMGPMLCTDHTSGALVATMAGEAVVVIDPSTNRVTHDMAALRQATPASCGPEGLIATADVDGMTRIWDIAKPPTEIWSAATPAPWTAIWAGDTVISTHRDLTIRSWDAHTGRPLRVANNAFSPESAYIESNPSGAIIATNVPPGADDVPMQTFPMRLRDPATLEERSQPALEGIPLDIGSHGLLATGQPGAVNVYGSSTGERVARFTTADPRQVENAALLPDGRHIVLTATFDPVTQIIDLDTRDVVAEVCTRGGARPVAVSPDGRWLALSESGPRTVVFDLPTLLQVGMRRGATCENPDHPSHAAQWATIDAEGILGLEFSPDSRLLAIAGGFGRVLTIFDVPASERVLRLEHEGGVGGARFSPDGKRLAVTVDNSTRAGGSVRVYTLDVDELKAIAVDRLRRELTPEECQVHLDGRCRSDRRAPNSPGEAHAAPQPRARSEPRVARHHDHEHAP